MLENAFRICQDALARPEKTFYTRFTRSSEEGVEIDMTAAETPLGLPLATLRMVLPTMKKGEHSTLKLSAPSAGRAKDT